MPILYSFRRCPYAIRARLAIAASGVAVTKQEVILRDKPQALLACSPKGTVPVLQCEDGRVLEQSLDIMRWALSLNDPFNWLKGQTELDAETSALISENDNEFKRNLDGYKYPNKSPAHSADYFRQQAEFFLQTLNERLLKQTYLTGKSPAIADMAILPFIRQFAHVDKDWFYATDYKAVQHWLNEFLDSTLFNEVMKK